MCEVIKPVKNLFDVWMILNIWIKQFYKFYMCAFYMCSIFVFIAFSFYSFLWALLGSSFITYYQSSVKS